MSLGVYKFMSFGVLEFISVGVVGAQHHSKSYLSVVPLAEMAMVRPPLSTTT
jgi:hypothetical protein